MALLDKLKDAKQKATDTINQTKEKAAEAISQTKESVIQAKESIEKNQAEKAQKKAEETAAKDALRNEMLALCEERKNTILAKIEENYSDDFDGFFNGKSKEEIFRYCKVFFESILLPGNSKDKSRIVMYPYVSAKAEKAMQKTFGLTINKDSVIAYINDTEGQEFLLTYGMFYFKTKLPENAAYFVKGQISTDKVSLFSIKNIGNGYKFYCDDVEIGIIGAYPQSVADFVTLDKFFLDMKNADYEITQQEIHDTICRKIGNNIVTEISNYYDDDSERIVFFTWTSDNGYVALTTNHMIVASRLSGGNVSNTYCYYYDEVTNLQIIQQQSNVGMASSHGGLADFLIDAAVTVAVDSAVDALTKNVCTLRVTANGSIVTLPGLVKVEADRISALYNQFKKEIRTERKNLQAAAVAPQPVIVQQTQQTDVIEQIKKLSELKDMGILSEEEFAAKKTELLTKL